MKRSDYLLLGCLIALALAFALWILSSCTTTRAFSITSEDAKNMSIEYNDSINVIIFKK